VVQLRKVVSDQLEDVDKRLRGLPGVKDVVIVEDAAAAYLKVDQQQFDEALLADFPFVRQGSSS
jgi:hypothetical protein